MKKSILHAIVRVATAVGRRKDFSRVSGARGIQCKDPERDDDKRQPSQRKLNQFLDFKN